MISYEIYIPSPEGYCTFLKNINDTENKIPQLIEEEDLLKDFLDNISNEKRY